MYIEFKEIWTETLKSMEGLSDKLHNLVNKTYRYGSSGTTIDLQNFTRSDLDLIYTKAKEIGDRSVMMQISSYTNVLDKPDTAKISNIKVFGALLRDFIAKDAINHWIFIARDGYSLPYLVTNIKYNEPNKDQPANTTVSIVANSVRYASKSSLVFESENVVGKTMEQALAQFKIEKESQELIDAYLLTENKFLEERTQFNKQYRVNGSIFRTRYSWEHETSDFKAVRAINDEEINSRKYTFEVTAKYWASTDAEGTDILFSVPTHPFLYLYSLETYENFYAHVNLISDYVYDDSLREKLILPETHSDLLDILTQDLSVLSGDIIEGKSSGTTILCKGKPGTGKTLTAEAYSEITHRPLYKINSGQLGTGAANVEKNLEDILNRAARWGAVMLIDEADTYIRERGNDIEQNAIVAAFLRTLEYFDGLLFMTTNRMDDVDDAIASRCIATIEYTIPDEKRATKIWQVLSKQFDIELSNELIADLVKTFPTVSGRDIKELLRLTGRFAKAKGVELSVKTFISCAQFRGVEINK